MPEFLGTYTTGRMGHMVDWVSKQIGVSIRHKHKRILYPIHYKYIPFVPHRSDTSAIRFQSCRNTWWDNNIKRLFFGFTRFTRVDGRRGLWKFWIIYLFIFLSFLFNEIYNVFVNNFNQIFIFQQQIV